MATLTPYLLVGLDGFIGANTRFVVARLVGTLFETRFPLGTLVINISGSFLLGVLGNLLERDYEDSVGRRRITASATRLGYVCRCAIGVNPRLAGLGAQSQVNAVASSSPRCTEVSARIPLADPRPALVVARRWASAAPAASLELAGAYSDRVEWVARRSRHVSNHVRSAARDCPVRSLSISGSIVSSL